MPLEHPSDTSSDNLSQALADSGNQQNLGLGVVGGLVASIIGAVVWAIITVVTGWQIGFMAIGVGFLVGIAVKFLGKGQTPVFGVVGAVFALLGCLAGNYLAMVGFAANEMEVSYMELLQSVPFGVAVDAMKEGFSAIDILFYAIAVFQGYKLSFDDMTAEV